MRVEVAIEVCAQISCITTAKRYTSQKQGPHQPHLPWVLDDGQPVLEDQSQCDGRNPNLKCIEFIKHWKWCETTLGLVQDFFNQQYVIVKNKHIHIVYIIYMASRTCLSSTFKLLRVSTVIKRYREYTNMLDTITVNVIQLQ